MQMEIKGIIDECFNDYKMPTMFIAFPKCSFKCDKENGEQLCQNCGLVKENSIYITADALAKRYVENEITKGVVIGGLEPFDSIKELIELVDAIRRKTNDPIIIYTGYTEEELENGEFDTFNHAEAAARTYWNHIKSAGNIVVKFGRYRPRQEKHFDEVLGIWLASNNQYAKEYK